MTDKLKLGLGALVLSAAVLLSSGCETCVGTRRLSPAQGCYQSSPCATGYYQQGQVYQPAVSACSPARVCN
mgnify:CR=1 FL=1